MTVLEKLIEQLKELKVKSVYDLNKPPKYSGEYRIALNHAIDRCNLLLEEEQEMLKEYHKSELLKLNKSDVIGSVCNHSWFPTTKDYKRAWKCTECKKVVHDKHLR